MTLSANYQTPVGAFEFWSDAVDACERADFDPCSCIEYVGVARTIPTTCIEHQEGAQTLRLSFQIKVF